MSKKVRRLFIGFQPDNYKIFLYPDTRAMIFHGSVVIDGHKRGRPSKRLTLHQKNLKILNATVYLSTKNGQEKLIPSRINSHKSYEELRLHFDKLLYPGKYRIEIDFDGQITQPMDGIYPCYFSDKGKDKMLIATQFESHYARQAFPCIDEPEAKATFELSLVTPSDAVVLSNTPVESRKLFKSKDNEDKLRITKFLKTPVMSTYLLAFVYGDMDYLESHTKDGITIRAYATPNNVSYVKFALDTAVKVIEFYSDYFDIPYPLKKCDLIALPDFSSGAMENWGCITFREQALLVDSKKTSLSSLQYVALVVAHELAHQWFGNLVTMRWWTDLWLNEGFASWMEYFAIDHLYPEWQMWSEFIVNEQESALKQDALINTHPVEVTINHPDEIRTIFDNISYCKGSSVINMLYHYLGEEFFRDGLRHYLKSHSYSNTDTVDLWESLSQVSNRPVKDFMNSWTTQSGFPVVTADIDLQAGNIALSQKRFTLTPHQHQISDQDKPVSKLDDQLWPIPLGSSIALSEDTLNKSSGNFTFDSSKSDETLLLLNSGSNGFFRTSYSNDKYQEILRKSLLNHRIGTEDRIRIFNDSLENAVNGSSPTTNFLSLIDSDKGEDSPFVWDIIASGLGSIRSVMADESLRSSMQPFVIKIAKEQLDRLGWEAGKNESHFDTLLRPTILSLASISKDKPVISEAFKRFAKINKDSFIDPNIRGVVYVTVAREGGIKEYNKLLNLHNTTNNSEEKVILSAALTAFCTPDIIKKALEQIDGPNVRPQDVSYWVAYSFANRFARDATWEWFKDHWTWLKSTLGTDLSFSRFPIYCAKSYGDEHLLSEYKNFFEPRMEPGIERAFKQGCEIIEYQSAWKKRDLDAILKFFR